MENEDNEPPVSQSKLEEIAWAGESELKIKDHLSYFKDTTGLGLFNGLIYFGFGCLQYTLALAPYFTEEKMDHPIFAGFASSLLILQGIGTGAMVSNSTGLAGEFSSTIKDWYQKKPYNLGGKK